MSQTILVVDDEQDILDLLSYNLAREGYIVQTASNGNEALLAAAAERPDAVILDIMMPELDGIEVCKRLRSMPTLSHVPVLFLTAKSGELDEVLGLAIGADDYIQKPVSPRLLVARVKAVLRRTKEKPAQTGETPIIKIGDLTINRSNYIVTLGKKEIPFARKEFELLAFLADNANKVFRREILLKNIWGDDVFVVDRTVDVHVSKIREKLGSIGEAIETVKGVGYRFRK